MKVLVTGSNGLVGSNLRNYVNNNTKDNETKDCEWIFTTSKDADLRKLEDVYKLFDKFKPTHVINLAAYVGGLYKNMKENVEFFENNILINMNVMKCCHKYNIIKLISIMSTCIFPDNTSYPINEKMLHDGKPHESNIGYSYSKRMIDILSQCYNNQYNTKFISIIPGNLYGPYDNFNLNDSHVIPALIHKCYLSKINNTDFIISGSGSSLRQFTYVKDFIELLTWSLYNYESNEPIILSNNKEISIIDIANIINKIITNNKSNILLDKTKSDGQYKKTISNDKMNNLLKYKFTHIENGLYETINWFINDYYNKY